MFPLTTSRAIRHFTTSASTKGFFSKLFQSPIYHPVNPSEKTKNQAFLPVRSGDELDETLLFNNHNPVILNFTVRGDPSCNKLTGALSRIVLLETEKRVSFVDIETDYHETRDSMLRFGVQSVPTLVAVRKTFPVDYYVPKGEFKDSEWESLKAWIEKNAD